MAAEDIRYTRLFKINIHYSTCDTVLSTKPLSRTSSSRKDNIAFCPIAFVASIDKFSRLKREFHPFLLLYLLDLFFASVTTRIFV